MSKRPQAFAVDQFPTYIERGQGARVWDVDGNEYIDFVMACGPATLGYCHPQVDAAIAEQLSKGVIFSRLTALEVEVAELITQLVPCAEMVRFFKGGAEANSAAVRIARSVTGREVVVSCGYRGWHDQWAVTHAPRGIPAALAQFTQEFRYNDLASLEYVLAQNEGRVAAVILDAVSGTAPEPGFLEGVQRQTRAAGALLIFDEIVTGFRLANGGAQQYFGVTPDLAVFAKGIANGMPLAAVAGPRTLMSIAADLFITLTYGDEALSLAAAKAALTIYKGEDVCAHLWRIGQRLVTGLQEVIEETGAPFAIGGVAPMPSFTCTGVFADRTLDKAQEQAVWYYLLTQLAQRGVIWRRHSLLVPSLAHMPEDIDTAVTACAEVFGELAGQLREGRLDVDAAASVPPGFARL
jgi:glutamate-1-semialdehyde aminotransferase